MKNLKGISGIIFDLDGTLVNTSGDVISCLSHAYQKHPEISHRRIDETIIGPPLSDLINNLSPDISETEAEIITKEFRACYDTSTYLNTTLYDGVFQFIRFLKERGYKLFIATNKPLIATTRIVQNLKINEFDDIISLDAIPGRRLSKKVMISFLIEKWNLDCDQAMMVGDDASDIIAAHQNGIISVAIRGGYGNPEMLDNAGAKYYFDTIREFHIWMAG